MQTYYKINSTRATYREYCWGVPFPLMLPDYLLARLGVRMPGSADDPAVESVGPCEVSYEQLPGETRGRFAATLAEFSRLGFEAPIYHRIDDHFQTSRICWATLRHPSGMVLARVHERYYTYFQNAPQLYCFPLFLTPTSDGGFVVSSAGKPDTLEPDSILMNRQPNLSVQQLWESHQAVLSQMPAGTLELVRTDGATRSVCERLHQASRDFHLQRGFFEHPGPAEQVAAAAAVAQRREEARRQTFHEQVGAGSTHDEVVDLSDSLVSSAEVQPQAPNGDVLACLRDADAKKTSWVNTLVILGLSVAAFMAVGLFQWREALWLLLPVLVFHELGHLAAMRLLGYRNLKMFFIPFFGAAVTGQQQNVAGWKKAVVALAGPLPGIALGIPLGIAGIALEQEWLTNAAVMLLILNGFNLLPVLPLDGGWVLHAVLFSRHPLLDVGFRGLAVVGLASLGLLAGDYIMLFVAIPLAISLPSAWRTARLAAELRREHPEAKQFRGPIDQSPVIQPIIERVRATFGRGLNPQLTANLSRNVLELVTARPPGWLASIGLLLMHGGAILATLVFAIVFVISRMGDFGDIVNAAAQQPQYSVDVDSIRATSDDELSQGRRDTVIATFFEDDEHAANIFRSQLPLLPAGTRLTLFGHSVLLSAPAGNQQLLRETSGQWGGPEVEFCHQWEKDVVFVALQCTAATSQQAEAIGIELNDMLTVESNGFSVHPPWSTYWANEGRSYADARKSWNTYRRLTQPSDYPDHRKRTTELQSEMAKAIQAEGVRNPVQALNKNAKQLAEIEVEKRERLRQEGNDQVDQAVIAIYDRMLAGHADPDLPSAEGDHVADQTALLQEQAAALQATRIDPENDPQLPTDGIRSGHVSTAALFVHCEGLQFTQIDVGLPALVRWLQQRGCVDFHYELSPYNSEPPIGDGEAGPGDTD